jgi:hypothetical protein
MAHIDIRKAHALTLEEMNKRARRAFGGMASSLNLTLEDTATGLRAQGTQNPTKGLTATVDVHPTDIRVQVTLPLLLRPMKRKIRSDLEEMLAFITDPKNAPPED